jgi:hypothetical protein
VGELTFERFPAFQLFEELGAALNDDIEAAFLGRRGFRIIPLAPVFSRLTKGRSPTAHDRDRDRQDGKADSSHRRQPNRLLGRQLGIDRRNSGRRRGDQRGSCRLVGGGL